MKTKQSNSLERYYRNEWFLQFIDRSKAKPWQITIVSIVMVVGDYLGGSRIQFPFLYVIPVSMAAWGGNRTLAYLLALLLPATRIPMTWFWNLDQSVFDVAINLVVRVIVLGGLVYLLLALQSVRLLRGILITCSYCHRIETDGGEWKSIELYLAENSEALLSHGVCPECAVKYWGSLSKVLIKG